MVVDPIYRGSCEPLLTSCEEDCATVDWCSNIDNRCEAITKVLQSYQADPDADAKQILGLEGARRSCLWTSTRCLKNAPVLTPDFFVEHQQLGESAPYHDVPAFFEISDAIVIHYLRKPTAPDDAVEILYFASGNHIAPLELGFQILEETEFQNVFFTYTEIYTDYYKDILAELCKLEQQGLIIGLRQSRGATTASHEEYILSFYYRTRIGEIKHIRLTYVLGKKNEDGDYPDYFRLPDYRKADIVIGFDAEDVNTTTKTLGAAHAASSGANDGKIVVLENRVQYMQWAETYGTDMMGPFSQHYGCETREQDRGLNLRPIIFRLKG